jgi:hypothetical protein
VITILILGMNFHRSESLVGDGKAKYSWVIRHTGIPISVASGKVLKHTLPVVGKLSYYPSLLPTFDRVVGPTRYKVDD